MSDAYVSTLMHCVFSTKDRRKLLSASVRERLFAYLGGLAREAGMKAPAVGGVEDHVHILLSIPAVLPVAKAVQHLKGASSKWIARAFPHMHGFAWQAGYGAFSVGVSQTADTVRYINRQEEHHRRRTFEDEFVLFLKKHGIAYDPKLVFG
jgi:REP element-mobilizing transposase RayT